MRNDFTSVYETWIEEKGWKIIKNRLPDTHKWECSSANRVKKKGRAKGGFVIGVRKDWCKQGIKLLLKEEGLITTEIEEGEKTLRIFSVYNNEEKWESIKEKIDNIMEEKFYENVIIGGDFNMRTSQLGGINIEEGGKERRSKDIISNKGGRLFVEWIQDKG